jgi:hypothetical protein
MLPNQNFVHISYLLRTTCPAHLTLLDLMTRIIFGEEWPNLRYYPGMCLKGLGKTTKSSG